MAQLILVTILCALLQSIVFPKLIHGVDMLFPNQTIEIGETLISPNQVFVMGFFSPGKSLNGYLGIWYKSTPDIVTWVANRNNPIIHHSQGAIFGITENGNLAITRGGSTIWSANSTGVALSNPVLKLLDTGNLVLGDVKAYLWQSFDYPTDTLLPGMKMVDDIDAGVTTNLTSWRNSNDPSSGDFLFRIENQGLPQLVVLEGTMKRFRTGTWNGLYFAEVSSFPNAIGVPEFVFKEHRMISMCKPYDSSIIIRVTLDSSGSFHRYTMNPKKNKWYIIYTYPRDQCDEYGHCGPNGLCTFDKGQRCECFTGFSPKYQNDWELQDWSGGCTRNLPLDCQGGDGFQEIRGVKYPDMLKFWLNTSMSLSECRDKCLKNCSCTAYANAYITNGGGGCVLWFGDLIDARDLSLEDSKQNIYIRAPFSEIDLNTNSEEEKKWPAKSILISIAVGVLFSGFVNGVILLLTRRKRQAAKRNNDEDIELPIFKMATIVAATNNFSKENIIGEGGFGPVYRGRLAAGEEIAVKRLSRTSGQGLEEFKNEVILIAKLQHRNLVRLLGCCIEGEEKMLVYEYMQNKSLDYFVFDQNRRVFLTWPMRFDIIMGIAKGLLYLHHDSRFKIIHRDLKTSNILLDKNWNPKISDFGLARIFEEDQSMARTKRVIGTYGYMAPEYAIDGKFSMKSDIFGLGVILIEIISGKKNRGFEHYDHYHSLLGHVFLLAINLYVMLSNMRKTEKLTSWHMLQAWLLWKRDKIMELMDECLNETLMEFQVKRCMHVALLCVQKFAEDRPIMSSVLFMLGTDGVILPEPKEPGFFMERSFSSVRSWTSPSFKSDNDTITTTDLEAR